MILFFAHAYIRSDVIGVRLLQYSPATGEVGRSKARLTSKRERKEAWHVQGGKAI